MSAWEIVVSCLLCAGVGLIAGAALVERAQQAGASAVHRRIKRFFRPAPLTGLTVAERRFPARIRADLQRALDDYFAGKVQVLHHCGIRVEDDTFGISLSNLLTAGVSAWEVPLQHEEVNVGLDQLVACPRNSLWLVETCETRLVVMLSKVHRYGDPPLVQVHVATADAPTARQCGRTLFQRLETAVRQAASYRGKVLSLDEGENAESYAGEGTGIKVHTLAPVRRDDVILPTATLDLVERNVIEFAAHRPYLRAQGLSTKKGLLLYGPPGNGKTYTIRYLISSLPGHTTFLVTGSEIGKLKEYLQLARLLQPSLVIVEDIDLIARSRERDSLACEEPLLNQLLNEMDGLGSEAEIIFIFTTNRPAALEEALAARPGRVDQAVEFGNPGAAERAALARLYAPRVELAPAVVEGVVDATEGASAAFIKELMRRSLQFHLARAEEPLIESADVQQAMDELLLNRAALNARILGFSTACDGNGHTLDYGEA